jgi:hypothetical protein
MITPVKRTAGHCWQATTSENSSIIGVIHVEKAVISINIKSPGFAPGT